ncbi:hypothetical protein L083_7570 [Actinoplanes sp. N902-109]|nr:hypothetical protein L083_7570 [Actinoplanes sp. N902-109]
MTGHSHVTAENVGGHPEAGDMADVARTVGIGPGDRGENVTHNDKRSESRPRANVALFDRHAGYLLHCPPGP